MIIAFLATLLLMLGLLYYFDRCTYYEPINEGDEGIEAGEVIESTYWRI